MTEQDRQTDRQVHAHTHTHTHTQPNTHIQIHAHTKQDIGEMLLLLLNFSNAGGMHTGHTH